MIPVSTLGWINVIIIIFVAQIFVFKRLAIRSTFNLSKKTEHQDRAFWKDIYVLWRRLHVNIAPLTVFIGLIHGYQALGTIRLHTGTVVLINLILLVTVGFIGYRTQLIRKQWRKIHLGLALVLVVTLVTHIYWRNLI